MSAEAAILTRSFPVGARTCTLTFPPIKPGAMLHMAVEWTPSVPKGLSESEWRQYRAGRDAAIAEFATELGINVAVVEL